MRIAILTYHKSRSCGALLQAYALKTFLERRGHDVVFPNWNTIGDERAHFPPRKLNATSIAGWIKSLVWYVGVEVLALGFEDIRHHRFVRFIKRYLGGYDTTPECSSEFDCLIVGSDQVWNPKVADAELPVFLGETVATETPMISYAASMGDAKLSAEQVFKVQKATSFFAALSVREQLGGLELLDKSGRPARLVVDPTFLIPRMEYSRLACANPLSGKPFLFLYVVNNNSSVYGVAESLARLLGMQLVCVDSCQRGLWRCKSYEDLAASPDRFLAYIRDADFVVTNSFHGVAFSIIYNKQFVAFPSADGVVASTRIVNLLKNFSLTDRIRDVNECVKDLMKVLQQPLPMDLDSRLLQIPSSSAKWLEEALASVEEERNQSQKK